MNNKLGKDSQGKMQPNQIYVAHSWNRSRCCAILRTTYGKLEALLLPGGNAAHGQSDRQQESFKFTINAKINAAE